ncbi:MAG: ATP-dependent helicase HrpB [Deltaproteobacteria bacterium]|nr:ATP-dependent helicase HrpB [Deltaproteobacteria bacterium]
MLYNTDLPIEEVIPEILRALSSGRNAVLEAPAGAGKTTIVPLALLGEDWLKGKRIIMLEPRRLAARAAASRMADLLGEEVGKTVGYRTRLDSRIGPDTRIEVVTEGILTRFLQSDPSLEGIGIIIFDEFHERSVHADLGLALSLEAQSVFREDLRILVMSATLEGVKVSELLGQAPIIKSSGRAFPVEVRYQPEVMRPRYMEGPTGPAFISGVVKTISASLNSEAGSILVFLPGSGEIKRTEAKLQEEKNLRENVDIVPLYGELPRETQDMAIRPSSAGRRKVVLATSIAETSLTIDGVRVVIDTGLMRSPRFSPSTGMSRLETMKVTKASAEQRCGRGGRLEPGVCIRLWAEPETRALRDKNSPEIMEADLTPLALELALWGVKQAKDLRWLDLPPEGGMSHARETLLYLGAIDSEGNATEHGRELARLPLHPRLGHMVIRGKELGLGSLACLLSALLTERDIFKSNSEGRDSDLRLRLDVLSGHHNKYSSPDVDRALCERIKAASMQVKKQLAIKDSVIDTDKTGLLLAFAYPDRIGKKREDVLGRFLLANGRGAYFTKTEPLSSEEYIVAANLDGAEKEARIFLAAPIAQSELEGYFADNLIESESVVWDQEQNGVSAKRQRKLWNIVLSETRLQNPSREKLLEAVLSAIKRNGLGVLPWDRAAENLRARINFLNRIGSQTGMEFPNLSDEWLLDNLGEWLAPWLDGMTRLEHLKRLDLKAILMGLLTWEQQQTLERLAPVHITVPTGSRIQIDYTGTRPVLAVRLQEVLGVSATPTIANGKVALVLHLLSPALRPVQVTEDLARFWETSYPMVKKEMKGRYPKHYWPDDPANAQPVRGLKKKEQLS